MLFRKSQWQDVAAGRITVAYRRWQKPTVKKGGRLRTPLCVLAIDDVKKLGKSARITQADARAAGFDSPAALKEALADAGASHHLYRIAFHPAGEDERTALRSQVATRDDDVAALGAALARLDGARPRAWTLDALALIDAHPATRAQELLGLFDHGGRSGPEALRAFKNDVRKLKALGLTESLDVGYRLSPRGRAWLERHRPLAPTRAASLPDDVLAALTRAKIVGIRAGAASAHRFVGVWPVVVDRRLFVRSWSRSPGGWWSAFSLEPDGAIHVQLGARGTQRSERELAVRATPVSDEATLNAIDAEYRRKFNTPGALQYVADLCRAPSRATTTELTVRSSARGA